MNRRKFFGLTIGGVAASAAGAREFPLANSQSTETQSPSSATGSIHISDREKAGLRGPVRTCREETIYPSGEFLTTTEYSLDGKLLTTRTVQSDGSEWVTSQTYGPEGRLAKTVSGKLGEPGTSRSTPTMKQEGSYPLRIALKRAIGLTSVTTCRAARPRSKSSPRKF